MSRPYFTIRKGEVVFFEDNPPKSETYRKPLSEHWVTVARELQENVGKWANVGNYALGVSTRIKQGRYKAFLPDHEMNPTQAERYMAMRYEVTTRKTGSGRTDIWMRALPA